jgi:hypothetical protein
VVLVALPVGVLVTAIAGDDPTRAVRRLPAGREAILRDPQAAR